MDFSTLYRTYVKDVHRFVLFLSGDPYMAEDIVSETFTRVWIARARVDLTTVKAYLFAVARNLFLQHRRRTRRLAALDEHMADPRPGPHERADARDQLRIVLAALQALPEIDRSALLMRSDAALPYEEIARTLGISESAAKVKVHRSRLTLRAAVRAAQPNKEES